MGGLLGGYWGRLGCVKELGRARKPVADEWASTLCKQLVGSVGKTLVGIRGNGEQSATAAGSLPSEA